MRIVHLSYAIPRPAYRDPIRWLDRISFITGIFEAESLVNEVHAFFHIRHKGVLTQNGVFYHFTNLKAHQLIFPFRFHSELKPLRPDVVIVHGLIFPLQVLLLRFTLGPHISIILQHHAERPFRDGRKYLQRLADRYISAYLFSSIDLGRLWVEGSQIQHLGKIYEVMGTSSTFYPIERNEAKQITHVDGEKNFLWVGGLDENKDPLTLVKAFLKFVRKNPNVRLYMIFQNDQLLPVVKSFLDQSDEIHAIKLIGRVDHPQLQYWYNSADFIISSSHYEGSGIAVCEALSCGCIPIVTDIPSFRMMTASGEIGFLYPAGDSEALLGVLEKGIGMDQLSEKRKVLARFNRELSFQANARKISDVIQKVKSNN